ncbi:MAG: HDIG domain-containing protein [Kiritimatiellae bacterium]|nr:HDIG domain-containing protein [Kiritimatiellia bacterium]MDD5521948.1 HDIG domain-containing protein [Kiritimatiellia bacterium]
MKEPSISKIREKKTREREKHSGKTPSGKISLNDNRLLGILIAVALWITSILLLGSEEISECLSRPDSFLPLAGNSIFILISLFATGLFLEIVRPGILRNNSIILLLSLVSLLALIPTRALLSMAKDTSMISPPVADFLLPLALAPLLATILMDGTIGMAVGVWTSLVMAIMTDNSFSVLVTGMIATVVTASTATNIRTRRRAFRAGLVVGLAEITCVSGLTALNWQCPDITLVIKQSTACLASGFFSASIALIILPLFEMLFDITTDITLLELSDPAHPLLQRLSVEAPGTYHHSLLVANLAQAAADEIGANSLLARISAYFHDVGKLVKPEFFAENMQLQNNPHDDLPPSMSTLVIISHVKEGVSLGMLHKLPPPIIKAIQEHHGTSLLSYFHYKAKSQLESKISHSEENNHKGEREEVDESGFRYQGPKPTSRESAILCLADAVEAASRTMEKKIPANIEDLVNEIINMRLEDGQLDECNLTLSELAEVRRSFVFTLLNMFHGRVPYPKDED